MRGKSKFLGHCAIILILYSFSIFPACLGRLWKTEDAYIIDDVLDDDPLPTIHHEHEHEHGHEHEHAECVDSTSGAKGQCVPMSECNPFYNFLVEQDKQSNLLQGLQRYLNGTGLEPCKPSEFDLAEHNFTSYVCCTSLKYNAAVRSINFTDYLALDPEPNEIVPEIPFATPNETDFSKIVSGSAAQIGEFPYAVAIIHNGRQMCGGSLIGSQWILSAAHCFDQFTAQGVRSLVIKVGDHDITRRDEVTHQDHPVQKLFLHPGFFRTKGYFRDDVALLKLRTPVSSASHIKAVALHAGAPSIANGLVEAVVCGWGKTCGGSTCPQSSILRKTKLAIVSNSGCSRRYAGTSAPPITENMVCAGGTSSMDACNGDSGGPLVIYSSGQTMQIGIVSWGIGCGQYPGVYTRVSSFVRWINKYKQKKVK